MRITTVVPGAGATSAESCSSSAWACAADHRVEEQERRAAVCTATGSLDTLATWERILAAGKRRGVHRSQPDRQHPDPGSR
jgi:hypothetical protein